MESLSWEWKVEPQSPSLVDLHCEDNAWLFEDDLAGQDTPLAPEKSPQPTTRSEVASKLLEHLDEWIKEEPFSDWLEEKIDLPIFEDLPEVETRGYVGQVLVKPPPPHTKMVVADDTQTLLQEFETVFGEVEMNNGTLTPPQSPTLPTYPNMLSGIEKNDNLFVTTLHQLVPVQLVAPRMGPVVYLDRKEPLLATLEQMVPSMPNPDVALELAEVEELVRIRVEDMVDPWGGNTSPPESECETPPSPCTSSNGSCASGEEDPDWIPVSVQTSAPGKASGSRRSSKPYARPVVEEKRIRKKEQNKNAATRYRQKKKAEIEEILNEEKGLEDTNKDLHQKSSDLEREIKYLKGLMRDLFKAKGLLK